jgi:hypothetical protein
MEKTKEPRERQRTKEKEKKNTINNGYFVGSLTHALRSDQC